MEKKKRIPYIKKLAGDKETPITLFQKFVGKEKGFLLETADVEKGRYSFIGKNPYGYIRAIGEEVHIAAGGKEEIRKGRVLEILREFMEPFQVENATSFPFIGGAIGTVAYDIIRQYEKLPEKSQKGIEVPEVELMVVLECIVYDHFFNEIALIVLEEDSMEGKERALEKLTGIEKTLEREAAEFKEKPFLVKEKKAAKSNMTKEEFMDKVKRAKRYIYEGDIFQVVLSQRWEIKIQESAFSIYRRLRRSNPSPYMYYLNFGDYQVVGSSPEMLVKVENRKIYTCPIAGTRRRGNNEEEDKALEIELLEDEKERAEHGMLVDLARNDMGRAAEIGSIKVTEFMKVKKFSHVMHLVSLVEGQAKEEVDAFNALAIFQPAGTLSGAPKIRAMEIIEELERDRRGNYGGTVGYFGFDGNMDMCIAIRTMILHKEIAYMQAGAGIVADSDPEAEYEETRRKIAVLVNLLGRFEE